MAKKTTKKKKTPVSRKKVPAVPADAAALKRRLKKTDTEIVNLLNQRAELARQIAKHQTLSEGSSSADEDYQKTLALVERHNKGPLADLAVLAVFRELLSGCRSLHQPIRVAHLGPMYSYSHLAAIQRFGQSVELVSVGTIGAVFEEVDQGQADLGLVPIENSTDGRIADTLDMFTRLPVRICGEVELPIHHTLLAKCPRTEIREVYSKPQALSQCRNWLAKHLPGARAVEVTSTSTAAELAAEKPGTAAIASLQAGIHYGLDALAEQIEDNPDNVTRFSVIGKETAPRTGKDKTALMLELQDRAGALAEALNIFKRNRVNLTLLLSAIA